MGPNSLLGVILLGIGGLAAGSSFVPFRGIRRWSFAVYWLVGSLIAFLLAPLLFTALVVPHAASLLSAAPHAVVDTTLLWGVLWGIATVAFGLSVSYLGLALGAVLSLGLALLVNTLLDTFFGVGPANLSLLAVLAPVLALVAVALAAAAALTKARELTAADLTDSGLRDFAPTKGLLASLVAGIASMALPLGLRAAEPLTTAHPGRWANLPSLLLLLLGALLPNLLWTLAVILRTHATGQFAGAPGRNPLRATATSGATLADFDPRDLPRSVRLAPSTLLTNYALAILAGLLWYAQLVLLSRGHNILGAGYSAPIYFAATLLIATLWGLAFRESQGTSRRTQTLLATALILLLAATAVVGYTNTHPADPTTHAQQAT